MLLLFLLKVNTVACIWTLYPLNRKSQWVQYLTIKTKKYSFSHKPHINLYLKTSIGAWSLKKPFIAFLIPTVSSQILTDHWVRQQRGWRESQHWSRRSSLGTLNRRYWHCLPSVSVVGEKPSALLEEYLTAAPMCLRFKKQGLFLFPLYFLLRVIVRSCRSSWFTRHPLSPAVTFGTDG